MFEGLGHQRRRLLVTRLVCGSGELERDDRVHQSLLGPVVKIANDPLALLLAGGHDTRARLSAFAIAVATRSVKRASRSSAPGGSDSAPSDVTTAPHRRSSTTIGAPT